MTKIPEGFSTITPYMVVKDASSAIALYQKAFGAVASSVMRTPDGSRIVHACLTIGNSKLFIGDENPQMGSFAPSAQASSVSFYLYVDDADAAQKKAVGAGLKEEMPVQDMFWGDRMGSLRDNFGYKWNLATQVREMSDDEVKKAAEKFFSKAA